MSNDYFQFKQFRIGQGHCAMKVSTDACILGAWTPLPNPCRHILDLGAGTGLLSLMLAQRAPEAQLLALELDPGAARQAAENGASSAFASRIRVLQTDAAQWQSAQLFDLIICNPPFFKNALKGPDARRNAARHVHALDASCLLRLTQAQLAPEGFASFLWPCEAHESFAQEALQTGLFLMQEVQLAHRPGHKPGRVLSLWGRNIPGQVQREQLFIKDEHDAYTPRVQQLMQPFYLYL